MVNILTWVLLTFIIKSYIFYFRCMESWNGVMAKVEKVKSGSETFLEACTYFIIINNSGSLFALWWSEESQTQHNTTKQCGAFKVKTLLREVKVKTRLSRVKGVPPTLQSTIYTQLNSWGPITDLDWVTQLQHSSFQLCLFNLT